MLSWPLVEVAINPNSASEADILVVALSGLVADDLDLRFRRDKESGQFVLGHMSEDRLEATITQLQASSDIQFVVGTPQVAYRERLGCAIQIGYTHKKHLGPMSQFAHVVIDFAPTETGEDFAFEHKVGDTSVPEEFVRGVKKGLEISKEDGLLAGFPLIDFKATLVGGAYHDIDSSVMAFQIAAQGAFREIKEKGKVELVEPIMKVEVVAPDEYATAVINDLNSRRGIILGQCVRGDAVAIDAAAPLANMFGYVNTLRALTGGLARYTMNFDRYQPIPLADNDPPFPPAIGMRA